MTGPKYTVPPCTNALITFPAEHVMLVTLNRLKKPKKMNTTTNSWKLHTVLNWLDREPSLRVAVITGQGSKTFCAGSDLLEIENAWAERESRPWPHTRPRTGSAGLSMRKGKKPVIAAVNGIMLGGGFEIVLNCDLAIASPTAEFGLPEVLVCVYAWSGGLPRLVRSAGMAIASDIALTGRRLSAKAALDLHLITGIAESPGKVLEEALAKAKQIASILPDGVIVTRAALREAWETASIERAFQIPHDAYYEKLMSSENSAIGLSAFRAKRKPKWLDLKL